MTAIRRTKTNLVAISALLLFEKATSFLVVVLMARYLGAELYGRYAFAVALATIIAVIGDLGITNLVTRDVSKRLDLSREYLSRALTTKFIASLILFTLLAAVVLWLPPLRARAVAVLLVGAAFLLRGLSNTFFSIIRAHQRMQFEAFAGVLNRIVATIGAVTMLLTGRGLTEVLIVFLFASTIELLYISYIIHSRFGGLTLDFHVRRQMQLLLWAMPFLLGNGMMKLNYHVDSVILTLFKGDAATGIYNAAYSLILGLIVIQMAVGRVLLPVLSRYDVEHKQNFLRTYRQALKSMLALSFLIVLVLFSFSDLVVNWIYGAQYVEAILCLRILVWATVMMFCGYILSTALLAMNGERQVLNCWIAAGTSNILANLVLVPRYSYVATSVSTVISESVFFLMCSYYLIAQHSLPLLRSLEWLKLLAPFALALVVVLTFGESNLFVSVPLMGAFYVLLIVLTKVFSKEEMQTFVRFVRS